MAFPARPSLVSHEERGGARYKPTAMARGHNIQLSQDAALVAALAGTAMSFSHSAEDQAERWLRALRLHGQVGCALQALGVGEAPS